MHYIEHLVGFQYNNTTTIHGVNSVKLANAQQAKEINISFGWFKSNTFQTYVFRRRSVI